MSQPYTYDPQQKKVTVRGAKVFPQEIFEIAEGIEILDMSFGQLSSLPEDLNRLKNLKIAFFSHNDFQEVPGVLASCSSLETIGFRSCKIRTFGEETLPKGLRALILTDNQITRLPRSIGDQIRLQKLMMAGNQLYSLPEAMLGCESLAIVRFAVNNLTTSPDWLFQLPHLAWYGDASNPFSSPLDFQPRALSWHDIALGEQIGKSTNNIVYRGRLPSGQEVAIKLYGHALVTDGSPIDDMNACLEAGNHPNIVGGIGRLVDAPDGTDGLVMLLIPAGFKNLGNPPTLETICRDTYPEGQRFLLSYVVRTLRTVAVAMRHLHHKGIMHGDLYAHNILTNETGESYVGDFGAASLYRAGSPEGRLRERVDVRAFGILIEELTARCKPSPDEMALLAKLDQLKQACLDKMTADRPLFADIDELLAA